MKKTTIVSIIGLLMLGSLLSLMTAKTYADVTTTTTKVPYSCNGSTTEFDFSFPITSTSDLKVMTRVTATGVEATLTESTHYTLSATNNDYTNGGTVTTVATYASGITLHLIRNTPQTQSTTLQDSGILRVAALEAGLDRAVMLIQQLQEQLNRATLIPATETIDMTLPSSVDRANQYLVFGSTGAPTVASSGFTSSDYTVSSYMEGILDDTSEGVFKATVNLEPGTDVQAYDAELAGLASVTSAANRLPYFTGSGTASVATFPAFARTYLDDADGDAVLATLGAVRTATVDLTRADIIDLVGTPITLVAAPGANKIVQVLGIMFILDYGTVVFAEPSAPDDLRVNYVAAGGTSLFDLAGDFMIRNADSVAFPLIKTNTGVASSSMVNRAVVLLNTGTDYTGGTGTALRVITHYVIIADGL